MAFEPRIKNATDASRFMKAVGFALRYNSTPSLPLAAMYEAAGETRLAIELTNTLLAGREVVESNVIANRLVLIHRDIAPAVYALRHARRSKLSENAERVYQAIRNEGHATSGDMRRFLGVVGQKRPDAADLALSELQRDMLIDRGPSSVPKKGIPYLSPEGFPYRVFEDAHPDLVRAASKMKREDAVGSIIETCMRATPLVTPRKLASMFQGIVGTASEFKFGARPRI